MLKKRNLCFSTSEIVISIFLLMAMLYSAYVGNVNPQWFLSSVSLFLFCMLVRSRVKLEQNWLIIGIVMIGLVQATYGIVQYFHWLPNVASNYHMSGSFDNPAGFAASLVAVFPFTLVLISKKNIYWRIFGVCAALILFVSIILSESRAGFLALIIVALLVISSIIAQDSFPSLETALQQAGKNRASLEQVLTRIIHHFH